MRFRFRTVITALVTVLALSALVASAASADAGQEFLNSKKAEVVKKGFTGKNGVSTLRSGGINLFECRKGNSKGEISGKTKVVKLVETFEECGFTETKSKHHCSVKSPGAFEGEIVTRELKGELGEVAAAEATSEVGLLLEPASTEELMELESPCFLHRIAITGQIAGEATPGGKLSTTGKLEFKLTPGKQQQIKAIARSEGDALEQPLHLWSSFLGFKEAIMEASEEYKFEEEVEVTKGA